MIGIPSLFAATFLLLSLAVSLLIKYFVFFEIEPTTLPPSNSIILVNSALFLYSFKEPVITKVNPSQDLEVSSPLSSIGTIQTEIKSLANSIASE